MTRTSTQVQKIKITVYVFSSLFYIVISFTGFCSEKFRQNLWYLLCLVGTHKFLATVGNLEAMCVLYEMCLVYICVEGSREGVQTILNVKNNKSKLCWLPHAKKVGGILVRYVYILQQCKAKIWSCLNGQDVPNNCRFHKM